MPRRARRKQLADISVYVASALESVAAEVPTRTVVLDEEATGKASTAQVTNDYRTLVERGDRSTALQNITAWLREETHATGAAIALLAGNEIVCVASAGTAPPVGVTINPSSGISGACIQSEKLTVCDDAATDPRVNPGAGHYIRSIVASPVKSDGRFEGLVEILSATPYAFDRNQQHVVEYVAEVVSSAGMRPTVIESRPALLPVTLAPLDETRGVTFATTDTPSVLERTAALVKKVSTDLKALPRRAKIAALVAPVLLGGVLLTWSVSRTSSADEDANQPKLTAVEPAPTTPAEAAPVASLPQSEESVATKQQSTKLPKEKVAAKTDAANTGEQPPITLRPVQQNLLPTQVKEEQPSLALATPPSVTKVPLRAPTPSVVFSAAPSQRSGGELIHKVTPVYPRMALAVRLAGKVELMASVGTNGRVSNVRVLSGQPQFVQAAVEAVSQWRYKPLLVDGHPTTQELPVTISFKPRGD